MKDKIKKVILIVLDGFGLAAPGKGNPITSKEMPYFNSLISSYSSCSLVAAGLVVGLEWGTYGNSEVGHGAIGAGRVVVQSLARINEEIRNESFYKNKAFLKILSHAKEHGSKIHLIGCVSAGGIHSHEEHLFALLELCRREKCGQVYVHMITDGEDSGPTNAIHSTLKLEEVLPRTGGKIATVMGRNYGMDRVKNWSLTQKAWDTMVRARGEKYYSLHEYIESSYTQKKYDADIAPASYVDSTEHAIQIDDNDGLIFFNYRNDRMKQLVAPFVQSDFDGFDRVRPLKNIAVATMTYYSDAFLVEVAYPPHVLKHTLGEVISNTGATQLRLAEGEKEAHVTNFFNGGKIEAYTGEQRLISSSRQGITTEYLEHPEMAAQDITNNLIAHMHDDHVLVVVNFANTDMIAHTGNSEAVIKALHVINASLKHIVEATDLSTTAIVITADHGNAEEVIDPATGNPDTQHSTADVPCVIVHASTAKPSVQTLDTLYTESPKGSLIDIAPTVLALLDIPQPSEMTGSTLL